jgi:hypothetical protein
MLSATCERWFKLQKRKAGRSIGRVRKCEDIEGGLGGRRGVPASQSSKQRRLLSFRYAEQRRITIGRVFNRSAAAIPSERVMAECSRCEATV